MIRLEYSQQLLGTSYTSSHEGKTWNSTPQRYNQNKAKQSIANYGKEIICPSFISESSRPLVTKGILLRFFFFYKIEIVKNSDEATDFQMNGLWHVFIKKTWVIQEMKQKQNANCFSFFFFWASGLSYT